jgi:signal transduction histidine kinase
MENEPRHRILVVDDDPQIRDICRRTLEKLDFDVQIVETGDQALALLKDQAFDFVLTDINMPGSTDGVKLAEEVKYLSPATDVVIMTGYPTVDTAILALKQGVYDYMLKPFSPAYLECVVTRCFEKRRLSKELDRETLMRRELEAAYAELKKLERLKAAFLGRLQHELRTPLTRLIVATEMIDAGSSNANAGAKLKDILLSGTSQMRAVVEQLLLFSDVESPEFKLEKTAVDMEATIRALVEDYRAVWAEKELKVEILLASPMGHIWGDADLLKTAFKHLLLNAVHFSNKGGTIRIQGAQDAKETSITFNDTGIGIPESQAEKVFDSFYQVAEHMTRTVGGLGLGLAIVRRIVEAHGGAVSVKSRKGAGSTFTVRLPNHQFKAMFSALHQLITPAVRPKKQIVSNPPQQ